MAETREDKVWYNLPVYKALVNLGRLLHSSTLKSPNYFKIGLLVEILKDIVTLTTSIRLIAESSDKEKGLKLIIPIAKRVLTYIRYFYDVKFITPNGFALLSSISEDINRLLFGWLKSCSNND